MPFLPAAVGQIPQLPHHRFEARFVIGLGEVVDLLTPFAVVGAAALVLVALRPAFGVVALAGIGAVAYVSGHGMHLASNAIPRDDLAHTPALRAVHFWDEQFSHAWWLAGLLGLLAAFSLAATERRLHPGWAAATAALLGAGIFVQSIEGGTWWLVLLALPFFVARAVARPAHLSTTSAAAVAVASVGIGVWAAFWGELPQPSDFL